MGKSSWRVWVEEKYGYTMVGKEHRAASREPREEGVKQQSFLSFQKRLDVFAAEAVERHYPTSLLKRMGVHVSSWDPNSSLKREHWNICPLCSPSL
jgi:hypothetical protein